MVPVTTLPIRQVKPTIFPCLAAANAHLNNVQDLPTPVQRALTVYIRIL